MRTIWALSMAAMVIALPQVVSAQATGDFRLPPASTPTPRIQGPTDSDNPVLRPTTPVRNATPTPAPSAMASSPAPAPSRAAPSLSVTRSSAGKTSPTPAPRTTRPVAPDPLPSATASPSETPSATPSTTSSHSSPALPPASPSAVAESAVANAPLPQSTSQTFPLSWPWYLGLGLAILALGAWWLHGRPARIAEDDWNETDWLAADEKPAKAASEPEAEFAKTAEPQPIPSASHVPAASAPELAPIESPVRPSFGREVLALSLDPVRMSATLTSTTLSYRLTVTNKGSRATGLIAVAGSMISAHASLPAEVQLATDGQPLELLHEIASLAPGEATVVNGELRLPLPEITPIKSGESLLFIPLVRFRAETSDTSVITAFALGETSVAASGGLLPLRIDMGPRIWNSVSRRQIELAAA